jgi:hypothetical protein
VVHASGRAAVGTTSHSRTPSFACLPNAHPWRVTCARPSTLCTQQNQPWHKSTHTHEPPPSVSHLHPSAQKAERASPAKAEKLCCTCTPGKKFPSCFFSHLHHHLFTHTAIPAVLSPPLPSPFRCKRFPPRGARRAFSSAVGVATVGKSPNSNPMAGGKRRRRQREKSAKAAMATGWPQLLLLCASDCRFLRSWY